MSSSARKVLLDGSDLGINAVSAVTLATTTGNQVRISRLISVTFIIECSAASPTGWFRLVPVDKDGADLPAIPLHDAAHVFADGSNGAAAFSVGPWASASRKGVGPSVMAYDLVKPQVEVTVAGTGTYTVHMAALSERGGQSVIDLLA